jgi:cell division protein FtsA
MRKPREPITAVEIGTYSLKVLMAVPVADGTMSVVGHYENPTQNGVLKGEVVNVRAVSELLSQALNEVEQMAGSRINSVYLAVTGHHVGSKNVQGSVPVNTPDRVITDEEVVEATRHALEHNLPIDVAKINSFQCSYIVDGRRRTSRPLGMVGDNLTADVHIVYGDKNALETQCKLLEGALGFAADDIAFSGIADYFGIAGPAGRPEGMLVIDIGAGVTEYAVFHDNGCVHSGQLTVGCMHAANDLSVGLRLPFAKAREVLRRHGSALRRAADTEERIEIEVLLSDPPRMFSKATIATILEARFRELFEVIYQDLENAGMLGMFGDEIALCGGGALVPEIDALATSVFHLPARIATPAKVSGGAAELDSPRFATPVGLLHLGHRLRKLDR